MANDNRNPSVTQEDIERAKLTQAYAIEEAYAALLLDKVLEGYSKILGKDCAYEFDQEEGTLNLVIADEKTSGGKKKRS